jgi:hypothetical protein
MFQALLGSIDQTLIQISREGFAKEYLGILFVLLIKRNTMFARMMGKKQRFFLTASRRSRFLLHCIQISPLLVDKTVLSFPHMVKPKLMKRKKRYEKHSMIKRSQNIFQAVWGKLQDHQSLRMSPKHRTYPMMTMIKLKKKGVKKVTMQQALLKKKS